MNTRVLALLAFAGAAAISVMAGGCQKAQSSTEVTLDGGDGAPKAIVSMPDVPRTGGALLWSQNCARCHNLRNPSERNDREWEVIVHHMRVRANLTAEEHRLILAFLQSAN